MSVSFDLDLGQEIRAAAEEESKSVSAWLAEAARERLRQRALRDAIAAWEEKYGKLSEDGLAEADAVFEQARDLARQKAARKKAARRGTRS